MSEVRPEHIFQIPEVNSQTLGINNNSGHPNPAIESGGSSDVSSNTLQPTGDIQALQTQGIAEKFNAMA
ncbi:MAG: hypothetical protein QNJ31_00525 [Candidatus Caenarcaniphilales bacterium]|nr:hypothetical protein [Candidatus Caenarcaniphilales bacterium]